MKLVWPWKRIKVLEASLAGSKAEAKAFEALTDAMQKNAGDAVAEMIKQKERGDLLALVMNEDLPESTVSAVFTEADKQAWFKVVLREIRSQRMRAIQDGQADMVPGRVDGDRAAVIALAKSEALMELGNALMRKAQEKTAKARA